MRARMHPRRVRSPGKFVIKVNQIFVLSTAMCSKFFQQPVRLE